MFKRVVVVTDLSPAAYTLLNCLGGLNALGAEKCLLMQCMSFPQASSVALSYSTTLIDRCLHEQSTILENHGFQVETRIITGVAKNEINRTAEREKYSLIVAGAQVCSLTSELFFGGLVYDLIHHASKPVLIIRLEEDELKKQACFKATGCHLSHHVLFPTDFSENADHAFSYVSDLAAAGVEKIKINLAACPGPVPDHASPDPPTG
ncbi:MAG: universal stress protein [Bacillota bacterium]|nr:universal stress protein [Bacillota bacterium]MDW7678191.1 universal stress protein [Bacillota bacterium]